MRPEVVYPELDRLMLMGDVWRSFWWELMKPYAIRMLATEIERGAEVYVEQNRRMWDEFPFELDVLRRMNLEERAKKIGRVLSV